ncbi:MULTISPECIES: ComF family protein [Thermus]|uniref:Amidophosphoribosyltransferase n=7 Tax=Thermus scotoductus TaxID=37636 RepID=A0A0N0IPZ6_THESC|nr:MULTISPECIES: ComF family protein [Thermus]ETN88512.1 competence protein ComF [Thermus sp. NMX2.A1]KPD26737.1 competence protein ComF [Thermus scotoductus]RTI02793.1 amidophosphoribosyltransferase [Thermus scotoductus]RTI17077.1 amidophosphoribosyltransferase [Thermus scotoductus]
MLWGLLEGLLGHACPGCGGKLDAPLLCFACRQGLKAFAAGEMVYLGLYGRVGGMVRALKYGRRFGLAPLLAEPLAEAVLAQGWGLSGVTAIPTLLPRLVVRGYNPPELLGRILAARLGLPYLRVLRRVRYTPSQPTRGRARRRLPEDLFVPVLRVEGSWLLVDDVLTSGTTFLRAKEALLKAGASRVYGAFLAVRDPGALGPYR